MPLEEFLERHPVFTWKDFHAFLPQDDRRSVKSVDVMLCRLGQQGAIGRIRRGLYYAVLKKKSSSTCSVDLYLAASRFTDDAVLGYLSALDIHAGARKPTGGRIYFFTGHKARTTKFRGVRFVPCTHPESLLRTGWTDAEIETVRRPGFDVRVTSPERTLVDILSRLKWCGDWRSSWPRLKKLSGLNLDSIVGYLERLDNSAITARVGWYIDRYRRRFDGTTDDYALFENGLPGQPRYLVPGERGGMLVPDWNIIVPTELAR
ncbi:MAG: hypothetical protein HY897_02565 [Deltaproteobacteria bacterium]|nr:hypothetical protein [Deltaproteobacteria bacterium]